MHFIHFCCNSLDFFDAFLSVLLSIKIDHSNFLSGGSNDTSMSVLGAPGLPSPTELIQG